MLFASRYSNFTCLDSSCLQASITVMTCLVRAGGGALQYCYKLIIAISAISPSSTYPLIPQHLLPHSPPQYIGSSHLSPGVSLIYDLAYDSGMLQSELFTSRNQNLVLAKLPNSGFWRYGQFFK